MQFDIDRLSLFLSAVVQIIKIISSKITYADPLLANYNHFLFLLEHLSNTFEATVSWTVGAA